MKITPQITAFALLAIALTTPAVASNSDDAKGAAGGHHAPPSYLAVLQDDAKNAAVAAPDLDTIRQNVVHQWEKALDETLSSAERDTATQEFLTARKAYRTAQGKESDLPDKVVFSRLYYAW